MHSSGLELTLRTLGRVLLRLAVWTSPGLSYMSHDRDRGPKQCYQSQDRDAKEDAHWSLVG